MGLSHNIEGLSKQSCHSDGKEDKLMRYYVNKNAQANGDHEVHTEICKWLPEPQNRLYLGDFNSCQQAVAEAKKHYRQSNGGKHCSPECHTS